MYRELQTAFDTSNNKEIVIELKLSNENKRTMSTCFQWNFIQLDQPSLLLGLTSVSQIQLSGYVTRCRAGSSYVALTRLP